MQRLNPEAVFTDGAQNCEYMYLEPREIFHATILEFRALGVQKSTVLLIAVVST